jgi:hypothetical protein
MGTIIVGQENSTPVELYSFHGWPLSGRSWESRTWGRCRDPRGAAAVILVRASR